MHRGGKLSYPRASPRLATPHLHPTPGEAKFYLPHDGLVLSGTVRQRVEGAGGRGSREQGSRGSRGLQRCWNQLGLPGDQGRHASVCGVDGSGGLSYKLAGPQR